MKKPRRSARESLDRSRDDIERIHEMLRIAIAHIEKKTRGIVGADNEAQEESLDDVLTGLTKVTALISKLIPIEREIVEEGGAQGDTILEEAIDWEMLENYFKKKNLLVQGS